MPRSLSFLTFVLGSFHSFHTHILSLLLIHESRFANTLGVSANEKYPHHPMRYWFNFFIRYSIGYGLDRKSRRLNSSHVAISYAVFCLKKKNIGQASAHT